MLDVRKKVLSERDGNTPPLGLFQKNNTSVRKKVLSERDGNCPEPELLRSSAVTGPKEGPL
jgi:hypothetical protein